jgi:hypothetical protein
MFFRALNEDFDAIDIVENYDSAIWTERYGDVGDFEIFGVVNTQLLTVATTATYIFNAATSSIMVIEKVKIEFFEEDANTITISGRAFESFLDRRVALTAKTLLNPTDPRISQIICDLVSDAFGPADPLRHWEDLVVINETTSPLPKLQTDVSLQISLGDNLLETVTKLCVASGLGFRCKFSPVDSKMHFIIYEGIDRTVQGEGMIVFSDLYDNLITASDEIVFTQVKNTELVVGNAVDPVTNVPILPVIVGDKQWKGLNRRETFFQAQQDKIVYINATTQRDMTDAEYIAALTLAGANDLNNAAYQSFKNFAGEIIETPQCTYGDHFNLGDIILFRAISATDTAARLDGITFSDDANNGKTLAPIFTYGV